MEKIVLNGDIEVNCYIIDDNNECFLIDPGCNSSAIKQIIEDKKLVLKGILLTHGHFDHIGAIGDFNVPVYIHKDDYPCLLSADTSAFSWFGKKLPFDVEKLQVKLLEHEDTIQLGKKAIKVIHTPGHTCGSVCYLLDNELYSGDTLFRCGVGRWDLTTGNILQLKKSIINLLNSLDDSVLVYPGHDDETIIGFEKQYNPYYNEWLHDT